MQELLSVSRIVKHLVSVYNNCSYFGLWISDFRLSFKHVYNKYV